MSLIVINGISIIITTLQKFPFALNHLAEIPNRKYAVIIDEAHSSQGVEASRKMTEALVGKDVSLEESEKVEREIENSVEFYRRFALIHPFYDANGRISRLNFNIYFQYFGLNIN